jgi:hypothetical protein
VIEADASTYSAFGVSASARGVAVAVTPGITGGPVHPAPCPRLALRPAPTRRTGVRPGTKQARFRAGSAVPTPSARPLCPQTRHRARRGRPAARSRRCSSRPRQRFPRTRRDHHSERRDPKLTFCKCAKSQSWKCLARTAAQACAARIKGLGNQDILAAHKLDGLWREPESENPASRSSRGRSQIRTEARRL